VAIVERTAKVTWYLDTSAFLKLITTEVESTAMRDWFVAHDSVWSSQLLQTEAWRAAGRLGIPTDVVDDALASVTTVLPSATTYYVAGRLPPPSLRSLDALHLAAAMELGDDLAGLVTYDERMATAARDRSIDVVTPA
jgi:predicted nucleic acid-binding protein